jgi:hypothetical protein
MKFQKLIMVVATGLILSACTESEKRTVEEKKETTGRV